MLEKHKPETMERLRTFIELLAEKKLSRLSDAARSLITLKNKDETFDYFSFVETELGRNPRAYKVSKDVLGKVYEKSNPATNARVYFAPKYVELTNGEGLRMYLDMLNSLTSIPTDYFSEGNMDPLTRYQTRFHLSKVLGVIIAAEQRFDGKVVAHENPTSVIRLGLVADHFIDRFAERVAKSDVATYKAKEQLYVDFATLSGPWQGKEIQYTTINHPETDTFIEVYNVIGQGCIYFFGFGNTYFNVPGLNGKSTQEEVDDFDYRRARISYTNQSLMLTCMAEENLEDWKREELKEMYLTSENWLDISTKDLISNARERGWEITPPIRMISFGKPTGRK